MLATLLLAALAVAGPPISLRLSNDGRYLPGDAVRASVSLGADGYLLVLHADPDGRVRVLFPLDPTDDAFVRGGRTYDLRTRGDRRDLFIAEWSKGNGTILAAVSRDPLQTAAFSVNGHWDYRTLNLDQSLDDESALREIALKMAPAGVEYDVAPYVIGDAGFTGVATADGGSSVVYVGVAAPYYGWGVGWYDPWYGYPCCGWGWGINIGWGYWGGYYPYYPWYGYGHYPYYPPYYPGYPGHYPGYPGHYPGYGGGGYGYPRRTWDGQPHPGAGGVGVQSGYHFNQSLASAGGTPAYRNRAAGNGIGVQASLDRPTGSTGGRRTSGGGTYASNAVGGTTGNTGRRADVGRTAAAMPRDVSGGYTGSDAPRNATYDRGARRRDGGAGYQNLPRDSRAAMGGSPSGRPDVGSYGRRSYDGGQAGGGYERVRPPTTYDRGGAYVPRSGSAGGYSGRSYAAPRSSGGSYGGAPRGYSGGGSRGYSGGSMGGGSRGFSGGGGGGGARGGGFRAR